MKAALAALLLAPAIASAQVLAPTPTPRPPDPTPGQIAGRSCLLPGWGQYTVGERRRAAVHAGIAAGLTLVTGAAYLQAEEKRRAYRNERDPEADYDRLLQESNDATIQFDVIAAGTIAFAAFSALDAYRLGSEPLAIVAVRTRDVLPPFATNAKPTRLAEVVVENRSDEPLHRLEAIIAAPELLAEEAHGEPLATLPPRGRIAIPVDAAFAAALLTEPREAELRVTVHYEHGKRKRKERTDATTRVHEPRAAVWDEPARIGAFTFPRDPDILALSSALVRTTEPLCELPTLSTAALAFDAIGAAGVAFTPDKTTPFTYFLGDPAAVAQVSFPAETLAARRGDEPELAALYSSLLESAGISSAVVRVPGKLLVLADLGVYSEQFRERFPDVPYVVLEGRAWVAVDPTLAGKPFTEALALTMPLIDAKREQSGGELPYVTLAEAWRRFPTSSLPIARKPGTGALDAGVLAKLGAADRALGTSEENALKKRLDALQTGGGSKAEIANAKGAVYARFQRLADAERLFEEAVAADPKLARAHANLAELALQQLRFDDAVLHAERAVAAAPKDPQVLLAATRAFLERGDVETARALYQRALDVSPQSAGTFPELEPPPSP